MLDFISKYLGHWVWYNLPDTDPQFCEYEKLRFSVYCLNLVMILALIFILTWGLRRQLRNGITKGARLIIPCLGIGLVGWVFQYGFNLSNFQSDGTCRFSDPPQGFLAAYGVPLCSGIVAVAFFFAGSYLLQLESRFHAALRGATGDGIHLEGFGRILGNSRARVFFALFGVVIIAFQWRAAQLAVAHSVNTQSLIALAARWLDAWGNCFAHLVFGLGLLREMNRERRDFVGMASACSMLFYGLVQLTALAGNALFFDGYILAALLKFALVLTMVSFGAMIKQMGQARDDERRHFTKLLIALNSTLQHELKVPLESLDLRVARLADTLPEMSKDLLNPVQKAVADAQGFFSCWPEWLNRQQVSLGRFLRDRRFDVKQENENDLYEASVPPLFLQWAVDRLRENARAAEATEIVTTLSRALDENKQPVVIVVMSNDGKPIANDAKLFEESRGTWVARYLMQLAGGALEWESNDSRKAIFRIQLPASTSAPMRAAAAAAMRS
jgi:hypothetical protein